MNVTSIKTARKTRRHLKRLETAATLAVWTCPACAIPTGRPHLLRPVAVVRQAGAPTGASGNRRRRAA